MHTDQNTYLESTELIDSDHEAIRQFVRRVITGADNDRQKAVRLYYAVRDGWRYNPYNIHFAKEAFRASNILSKNYGHCLDKAILLIAVFRAAGLPARLCLAKVRNHLAADRLEEVFGSNELAPHGYVEVWLDEHWIKATPAFNRELCDHLGVEPLDWDGEHDSLFQEYDHRAGAFMEYVEEYGVFEAIPFDFIVAIMRENYPHIFAETLELSREKLERLIHATR